MKRILPLFFLLVPSLAFSQIGTRGSGIGANIPKIVEKSTLTFTAPVTFDSATPVVFTTPPTIVGGATVFADAPLTGDGSESSHLGVDASSATLLGPAPDHSLLSNVTANQHHTPTWSVKFSAGSIPMPTSPAALTTKISVARSGLETLSKKVSFWFPTT